MHFVGQGDAIDRFVPVEDDPVAVGIDEPHRDVEEGATVRQGFFQGKQRGSGGLRIHIVSTHATSKKFTKPFKIR